MATIATLRKSDKILLGNEYQPLTGQMFVREATVDVPAGYVVNDVIRLMSVFKGETLHGFQLNLPTGLDTHGTPTAKFDLGYGNSDTATVDANSDTLVDNSADGVLNVQSIFSADDDGVFTSGSITFDSDTFLDVHVKTGPATGGAATVKLTAYLS